MIWLQCRSDDGDSMHPKSFFVKRRSQPLEEHRDIRTVQELLGLKDVKTAMICTHVLGGEAWLPAAAWACGTTGSLSSADIAQREHSAARSGASCWA